MEDRAITKMCSEETPIKPNTVNALIDRIIFCDTQENIQEVIIKTPGNIKHTENCFQRSSTRIFILVKAERAG